MTTAHPLTAEAERGLLQAAIGGDGDAYGRLVAGRRGELHAHCYRMLGSVQDAEDALQEALLRAWRGCAASTGAARCARGCTGSPPTPASTSWPGGGRGGCRPSARRARRRARCPRRRWPRPRLLEPYPDEALGVPDGLAGPEARYEQREAVELAFVAALQHLPRGGGRR